MHTTPTSAKSDHAALTPNERPSAEVEYDQGERSLRARAARVLTDETGASTAEYAIVVLAAVALAGVLVAIMRSGEIQEMLLDLVRGAFTVAG